MSEQILIPQLYDFKALPPEDDFCTLHRGPVSVRLARAPSEIVATQYLRAHVFAGERAGQTPAVGPEFRSEIEIDADAFDEICDHLIMTTRSPEGPFLAGTQLPNGETVVGCYRLLRRSVATRHGGFYSAAEYDVATMLAQTPDLEILELGRSCVAPAYRAKQMLDFLWQGLSAYVRHYNIEVLMGCASFMGTQPDAFALPLSYLHHFHAAQAPWRVRAHDKFYMPMNYMPAHAIDARRALRHMPPILRGYIQMGCQVGDGAVIDHAFGSVDVFVIFPLSEIAERYKRRYLADGE